MKKHVGVSKPVEPLPFEGLWVPPDNGAFIPVVEHLLALSSNPELFGLPESYRNNSNTKVLRDAAEVLIGKGWVRFRYLSGVYAFEVDNALNRIQIMEEVLVAANAYGGEDLTISQIHPRDEYVGSVDDLETRRILKNCQNPIRNSWRIS